MRKSVAIGFGVWLLAVASVAVIAWLAINTAGHQVTAVTMVGPGPTPSSRTSPPAQISVHAAPTATKSSTGTTQPAPSTHKAATQTEPVHAYYGTFSTSGGRVRARCAQSAVSLDGGYARPETGWEVRMLPASGPDHLGVFFGSQHQAIEVLAVCSQGRPAFTQQSQSLREGRPYLPAPQQNGQVPAVQPSADAFFAPVPAPTASDTVTPSASASPGVTPAPTETADQAQVAAYVQAQNDRCSQAGWSGDWCQRWAALTDSERYQYVQRWLGARGNGGGWTGYRGERDSQASRNATRDPYFPYSGATTASGASAPAVTTAPVSGSDSQAPAGSGISPTSGS